MTNFEQFLIDKGYIMYALNCKEMKYFEPKNHVISTMVNISHFYIHKNDTNLLIKIKKGVSLKDKDFTTEDRNKEICFGLHEAGKPPTLIYPRPLIEVKRIRNIENKQVEVIESEQWDDSMNIVLSKIDFEDILKAMYDKSIIFKFDLTPTV
jgi:hypothetical protein